MRPSAVRTAVGRFAPSRGESDTRASVAATRCGASSGTSAATGPSLATTAAAPLSDLVSSSTRTLDASGRSARRRPVANATPAAPTASRSAASSAATSSSASPAAQ